MLMLISVQISKDSSCVYTDRVHLIEFHLTLAMKILIPRPCLLSSGMKGFLLFASSVKVHFQ